MSYTHSIKELKADRTLKIIDLTHFFDRINSQLMTYY